MIKKSKDRLQLKNWRPISLLNCDYKILSKSLANRLKKILPSIIHTDQSGYVKNRNIAFALRTIQDTIDITNRDDLNGLLLFIDYQKAFDSVSHRFLFDVLKKKNFGEEFIKWIRLLYRNVKLYFK